ncbi:MAG: ATP-dependent zinc metalloprotease FtsH, partial [Thermodesulfobacteriota bacterium]
NNIDIIAENENTLLRTILSWVLPTLFFVGIWMFLMRRMGQGAAGGMMTLGKSKAKIIAQTDLGVNFESVAGQEEAKQELAEVIEFLKTPEKFTRLGAKIPKGILLVGPPGTGKTLLAKAVAGESGVPFFSISGSDFIEMFVGLGAARVRDLFEQANAKAPCIVFIDELDSLGKARGTGMLGGHDEREQTLNQLLAEMDGFEVNKGVVILAATNRPEILDPALLRPGRFDRHILVDRPDLKERVAILKVHTKGIKLAPGVELGVIARRTPGFTGADLANLVNEATLLAVRQGREDVSHEEFEAAIDRIVAGLEKKNRVLNEQEKKTVAYHETGHALIATFRQTAEKVHKISIVPRGIGALGYTMQLPTEDRFLMSRTELLEKIDVLLGGRAAERIIFGEITTGAQNDLQRATEIARSMVAMYGMNEKLGQVTYQQPANQFLQQGLFQQKEISDQTARLIDEEVRRIIEERMAGVEQTLAEQRPLLEKIAKTLLEKEALDDEEFKALLPEGVRAA